MPHFDVIAAKEQYIDFLKQGFYLTLRSGSWLVNQILMIPVVAKVTRAGTTLYQAVLYLILDDHLRNAVKYD